MVLFVIAVCYDLCTTFRTVLVVVALVHKHSVNAQLLECYNVVLPVVCLKLFKSCFQALFGLFKLLYGKLLTPAAFHLCDSCGYRTKKYTDIAHAVRVWRETQL